MVLSRPEATTAADAPKSAAGDSSFHDSSP
jgi:hypothetical protein